MTGPENRAALLAAALQLLRQAGVAGPERDARLLLRAASGLAASELSAALREAPGPGEAERFAALVARRQARQPMAQILGQREFWGRVFRVTRDVLDPRPETELLVELALGFGPAGRVLDLGTGSGALLVTLLAEMPAATGLGVDASRAALAVAEGNAEAHGVAARAAFRQGDWLRGLTGRWDLVVANPPYIAEAEMEGLDPEVRDWEPREALTPGGDGLDAYRAIAGDLRAHLEEGGRVLFEIGAGQGAAVTAILTAAGLPGAEVRRDLEGRERCVIVQR